MPETDAEAPPGMADAGAPRAFQRRTSDRIAVVNAIQGVVGAYLSPIQIEDVATAVLSTLRRDP